MKDEGRLVWNHSTHLQGLIPKLRKLCQQPGIYTVTPAVLGRARGNVPKLLLKVSVPIRGGFKLIARQGKGCQEVFVLTSLDQDELETAIEQSLS
ncbi:MAG: metal-binding protein [Synechococcales cyanobacterium CRU_2_2]|nr:metal-binding protein [Synechococcales cyanobacterium CRU_2_2]